jgi:hypothetical protein
LPTRFISREGIENVSIGSIFISETLAWLSAFFFPPSSRSHRHRHSVPGHIAPCIRALARSLARFSSFIFLKKPKAEYDLSAFTFMCHGSFMTFKGISKLLAFHLAHQSEGAREVSAGPQAKWRMGKN